MKFDKIPNIDIDPFVNNGSTEEKEEITKQVRDACEGIGFFTISGHGVSNESIEKISSAVKRFFDLSLAEKMKCKAENGSGTGYLPMNAENLAITLGKDAPPDLKESFNINCQEEKNKWPEQLPELRVAFEAYSEEMRNLAVTLMKIFARALGVDENYFEKYITPPYTVTRISNYPKLITKPLLGQLRAAAHTDYGTLTILLPDSPGLQVSDGEENWIDVHPPVNSFVINLGDVMERWTNHKWKSTLHRVITPSEECNKCRQAIVFFHNPNDNATISCIDTCCIDSPAKYSPELARDLRQSKSHKSRGVNVK